jgi:repressor LexA
LAFRRPQAIDFAFSLPYYSFRSGGHMVLPLTKRQREIFDYLNEFIEQHGYAPSLEEIGRKFGLSSLATVHKHLTNLQDKGFIKRAWNRSRSVEMVPTRTGGRAVELPLLGYVAAGLPIEAIASNETIAVPEDFVGRRDTYVLRVRGDSMIEEQIRDGDFVVVEDRDRCHAQEVLSRPRRPDPPAACKCGDAADFRGSGPCADPGRRRRGDAKVLRSCSSRAAATLRGVRRSD